MGQHYFSAKPQPDGSYPDYYAKMTTYAAILAGPVQLIDPQAKPQTFKVVEPERRDARNPSTTLTPLRAGRNRLCHREAKG